MQLPDLSLLLVMALFWACYFLFKKFVFSPLGNILEEREEKSETSRDALAKALEREKEVLVEVDNRLAETRRELMTQRDSKRRELQARRQTQLDAAREAARQRVEDLARRLDAEKEAARKDLAGNAPVMAAEIAASVAGRRLA